MGKEHGPYAQSQHVGGTEAARFCALPTVSRVSPGPCALCAKGPFMDQAARVPKKLPSNLPQMEVKTCPDVIMPDWGRHPGP